MLSLKRGVKLEKKMKPETVWQLMSADKVLGEFQGNAITIYNQELLPWKLKRGSSVESWLHSRSIDLHRPNSRILRKILRLTETEESELVKKVYAATITDNYWIRPKGSDMVYQDIKFSEDTFSDLALKGSYLDYGAEFTQNQRHTPELTNIGSYEKCWKLEQGNWVMYKAGSELERYSELFAYQIGRYLKFDMAEYQESGEFVKTYDFTRGMYNFEPMESLVGEEEDYLVNWRKLEEIDQTQQLGRQYLDMLYLDALVFNVDRHTFNYGVLRDQITGEAVRMAPNFDNNLSLISRGYPKDPEHTSKLLIQLFQDLLKQANIKYEPPQIEKDKLVELAEAVLPHANIDREAVVKMVLSRQEKLNENY